MNYSNTSSLNENLKKIHEQDIDSLNSDHRISWFFDFENKSVFHNKLMNTYEITYRKYGVNPGGDLSWGDPEIDKKSQDELNALQKSSSYEILETKCLGEEWYSALIAKITVEGKRVDAKCFIYSLGKEKEIKEPLSKNKNPFAALIKK